LFAIHAHDGVCTGSHGAQVRGGDGRQANDVRRQDNQDLVVLNLMGVVGEQIFRQRDFRKAGDAILVLRLRALDQAAQDAYFAFFQPHVVLNLPLADNRLIDASDVAGASDGRNFDGKLHAHLVVRMDPGSDVNVHADVNILKLSVHQGVDHTRAATDADSDARLKASCCHRDAIADLQGSLLSIGDANFRILNDARLVVGENEVGYSAG